MAPKASLLSVVLGLLIAVTVSAAQPQPSAARMVISLDGQWQIAEGAMGTMPETFDHTVAVPGLADLAVPAFAEVGVASPRREAFWYRRTFIVHGHRRAVAMLKIAMAQFGTKVWLNGTEVGEEVGCYAPGYFDVTSSLHCKLVKSCFFSKLFRLPRQRNRFGEISRRCS